MSTAHEDTDARLIYRIEVATTPEALAALEPTWNTLLVDSAANALFLTWAWIEIWWAVFGSDARLHVVSIYTEDERLVGLAPLMVQQGVEGFPRTARVLMLLGQQGDTLAERLDVIVARGHEAPVVEAMVEHLVQNQRGLFDVLWFERVPEASPTRAALQTALETRLGPVQTSTPLASPYLPLPAAYDDLRQSMSRNFRRQLANARNRLAREGDVVLRFAPDDVPVAEALDTLIALHRSRWGPGEGSFRTERYVAFHRALSERLAARGELVLVLLEVNGVAVAARYDFAYDERIWCFQGGWLPDYERMRIGTVLTADVMGWAIERGFTEYDFLCGDDGYKRRWAKQARTLVDLTAWGRGPRAWLGHLAWRLRARARALLRRS